MSGEEIPCPHCTFLNSAKRRRCAVCLKSLQKRRPPATSDDEPPSTAESDVRSTPTGASVGGSGQTQGVAPPHCSDQLSAPTHSNDECEGSNAQRGAKVRRIEQSPGKATTKAVRTLFSTAAGNPVHVSEEALQLARERLGASDGSQQPVAEPLSESSPALLSLPSNRARQASANGASRVVSSLFSTASGKAIEISTELLAKAEQKLRAMDSTSPERQDEKGSRGEDGGGNHASTDTAGSGGAEHKRSRDESGSDGGRLSRDGSRNDVASASEATVQGPRPIPVRTAMAGASASSRPFRAPRHSSEAHSPLDAIKGSGHPTGETAGRRRGFVPPQQKLPASFVPPLAHEKDAMDRTATNVYPSPAPAERAAVLLGGLRHHTRAAASSKITPLALPPTLLSPPGASSTTPTRATVPSAEDIGGGAFHFLFSDCGPSLAALLAGDKGGASPVPPPPPLPTAPVTTENWRHLLLSLGAHPTHCTPFWCGQMLISSLLQLRDISLHGLPPTIDADSTANEGGKAAGTPAVFTPAALAMLLCLRYNRELVEGDRPALRRLVEGDVPSASLMVLGVSAVCEERAAPHIRVVKLSDGFYHMKASLDVPLSSLVREGVLAAGRRLAVCGAKLLLHGQCTPEECGTQQIVMRLNYNCVRPVSPHTPLGLGVTEPSPLPMRLVHPLGGLVPALEGVVARVLPPFYVSQLVSAGDGAGVRTGRLVRNQQAQMVHLDRAARKRVLGGADEQERDAGGAGRGPADAHSPTQKRDAQRVSRVQSILVRAASSPEKGGADNSGPSDALIQHWETCEDEAALHYAGDATAHDPIDDGGLPKEGTRVVVYALNPAKSQTAAAPFALAKLFYASRTLHFTVVKEVGAVPRGGASAPAAPAKVAAGMDVGRRLYQTLSGTAELTLGCVVDLLGLCLGSCETSQGRVSLLLLADGAYALLQVPVPSATRELVLDVPSHVEPFLLLVQNATFISHEDSQAGSDCARVFANEYTTTSVQAQHIPRQRTASLESARTALQSIFTSGEKKHRARRDEIFRCCTEEGPPSRAAHGWGTAALSGAGGLATATVDDEGELYAGVVTEAVASSATSFAGVAEKRLPYYLRRRAEEGGGAAVAPPSSRGVVLLRAAPGTLTHIAAHPPTRRPTPTFHYYGNVTALDVVMAAGKEQSCFPLFREGAKSFAGFYLPGARPTPGVLHSVRVTWRYGTAIETTCAAICDGCILDELLDGCISAWKLRYLCGCDGTASVSEQPAGPVSRTESGETLPASAAAGAWWSLLQGSTRTISVSDTQSPEHSSSPGVAASAPDKWVAALSLLNDKLTHVLFKFTLRQDEEKAVVEHVFHIADNCPVAKLFT